MDLKTLTIKEARRLLLGREISSEELTAAHLRRIRERDPEIHAFLDVYEDEALEEARRIDKEFRISDFEFRNLALVGIPGAIKDNILIKAHRATAGSKMLEEYIAPYDATVTSKLRDAGAIFLGKTNLDEFAMGSSTENSAFGPTKNPHDPSRVPGGSSGGSAAAVSDGMALWTLGSDTGGSIRQPAGFCGVVGLKPTYGAVSRYGLIAMASSLDQIGPFAKTVQDVAIVFEAIAGRDKMDSTSSPQADYQGLAQEIQNSTHSASSGLMVSSAEPSKFKIQNLRVGVPKEYFSAGGGPASGGAEGIDPAVEQAVRNAIAKLQELGASIQEISLPHTSDALPCYYIIQPAEVSANLARYDGIRYRARMNADENQRGSTQINQRQSAFENQHQSALLEQYFATRGEGFGKEVRRRILLGTYVLSAGYYDAYYAQAQKVRRLIRDDFINAFNQVDVILAPTSPTFPFQLGERAKDPLAMYLADIYTVPANLAGVPALSLPYGRIGPRIHADVNADQRGLLYEDLIYKIRGALFNVYNQLGPSQKESVYQRAVEQEFVRSQIPFVKEQNITVMYQGAKVGSYKPDFVIDNKVILEIKAIPFIGKLEQKQIWHYLKGSIYRLAMLVNFGGSELQIERIIYDGVRDNPRFDPRESAFLPVGLQIIGKHFDEKTILQVGDLLEWANVRDF